MTPDPLNRFAPWPRFPEDATGQALIRHAVVRAHGALALVDAGHDVPRQRVRAVQYVAIATLLSEMHAEPARADVAARHLWARLGDGADLAPHLHAWVSVFGIDPDDVTRVAVEAYESRAADLTADSSAAGPVVHFAAPHICIDDRHLRQLCAWCGHRLADYDLDRVAVPQGQDGPPPTWPPGALVEVDGSLSVLLGEWTTDRPLPENTCHRRETGLMCAQVAPGRF